MDQCAILFVRPGGLDGARAPELRALGFRVDEAEDLPPSEAFVTYHAVIVRPGADCRLTVLANRLRAKPRFGRRVLLALVPAALADRDRRDAVLSGFDFTLPDTCSARDLAATILRRLRSYPEYRCILRVPGGRRKAA